MPNSPQSRQSCCKTLESALSLRRVRTPEFRLGALLRRCGQKTLTPETAARIKINHTVYLLQQLPGWQSRELISPQTENLLRAEYVARQDKL